MLYEAEVLEASKSTTGTVVTTMRLRYWRALHAEVLTHRAFSRNSGSSRAKPVKKVLAQVWNDPAGPTHWGTNQAGMQAGEDLTGWRRWLAQKLWKYSGRLMCGTAWVMMKIGLHKQVANRVLEPWQYMDVIVTATDWDNFFELRQHKDAQPEIQELAWEMAKAKAATEPTQLVAGEWHLPYVTPSERDAYNLTTQLKLSTARCARVSYAPFDGNPSVEKEVERHDMLVGSEPMHASPTEHQAVCNHGSGYVANFNGFTQYRHFLEKGKSLPST